MGELLCFVCLFAIFDISMGHIVDKRGAAVAATMEAVDGEPILTSFTDSYKTAHESVEKVVEETVWATEEVKFRTGPDKSYESPGSIAISTGVLRTGLTYNDWSQVEINGDSYYIKSKYLTTEQPLIIDGGAKGDYERYAMSQFAQYGWADTEITPLIQLWNHESGWNPNAHNGSSGAHGIPQALPASKMSAFGSDYYTNGNTQIRWGLSYIANRYGSPTAAWGHFTSAGWY